jgi:hypothetical protein
MKRCYEQRFKETKAESCRQEAVGSRQTRKKEKGKSKKVKI